jgi:hypothetical protein
MDENKINNLSKKLLDNIEFERPPKDFTDKLMQKIELAKSVEKVKPKSIFTNKFLLIFSLTFGIIILISYFFQGNQGNTIATDGFMERLSLPEFDPNFLSRYLNINFELGFIAKIIIGSVIALIVIDAASGSLIDRIIDSKTKRDNQL